MVKVGVAVLVGGSDVAVAVTVAVEVTVAVLVAVPVGSAGTGPPRAETSRYPICETFMRKGGIKGVTNLKATSNLTSNGTALNTVSQLSPFRGSGQSGPTGFPDKSRLKPRTGFSIKPPLTRSHVSPTRHNASPGRIKPASLSKSPIMGMGGLYRSWS